MIKKIIIFSIAITFLIVEFIYTSNFNLKNKTSSIQVASGSSLVIDNPISSNKGKIIKEQGGTISGSTITFEDGAWEDEGNKIDITGTLDAGAQNKITLNGGKTFRGKKGKVLQSIFVSGTGNRVDGNFLLDNDVELQDASSAIVLVLGNRLGGNVKLNSGTLSLEEDLRFADNKRIVGPGKVVLNGYRLSFGAQDLIWNEPLYFDGAADIEMSSNLHLTENWTFSGSSVLCGSDNLLYLDNGGRIIVERGSSLLIKHHTLRRVGNGDLFCMDNAGTFTFQNVKWVQDTDYTFSIGHFDVVSSLELTGTCKFIYCSPMQSNILPGATLILDKGVTFSYDPLIARNDLLSFQDNTSILYLDGATLHTTATGLQLTKGTMIVDGNCYLSSETLTATWGYVQGDVIVDNGITFGNNSTQEDFFCQILPGSKLQVTKGSLCYQNVQPDAFKMVNSSSILQFDLGSKLKLYQTLDSGAGKINFSSGPQIWYMPGKQLLGSVESSGYVFYRPL